ncbi:adenosine receptor A1-like [Oculina patagonica]
MTFPTPNSLCATVRPPTSLSYFTASFSVFLALVTIPGNFLVCLAIIKDPFRNLKTPFNYFLLSLAMTDLMVGALLDTVSVAFHIDEALQLNVVDIKILHMFYFILSTASMLTLAALTIDRYVAVASPVKYKIMVTSRRAIVSSVSIWVAALAFSFIYFKLGFIVYSFVFANTAVVSTFAVLIFVHVGILKRLRERSKYWRDRRAGECSESDKQENRNNLINTKKERKAAKALMIVLLAFCASLTPACVMIYLLNFCAHCSCLMIHWLRDLGIIIVLCNSGINPYLYAWRLPQFKRAFYKFLHLNPRGKISDVPTGTHGVDKPKNQKPEYRAGHEHKKISSVK